MYQIKDFFLGKNDGKKEARYKQDFDLYFYDHNNIYKKIMEPDKCLVLGKKGTGKTILGEYMKKQASASADWFCEMCSYKDFTFQELIHLKSSDIQPNEYLSIWEWVILLQLSKFCINDNSIPESRTKMELEKFINSNYDSLHLNANKIIEITKNNKLSGSLFTGISKVLGEEGESTKYSTGNYLNYLNQLSSTVIKLLSDSNNKYTLIYDELDDRFRNESLYKNSIISLIKAVDKLNLLMHDNGIDCKVILLLRTDIFQVLNDPDLNKVKQDNSITIEWGSSNNRNSPLFDMVFNKVKKSVPELADIRRSDLFFKLFPDKIKGEFSDHFILSRSFFRPRDVITYLNLIIQQYPSERSFNWKGFKDVEGQYSSYFFNEIRNELCGHASDTVIDEGFLLLKQFKHINFKYSKIYTYLEERKRLYKHIDLEELLKMFFDFGVLGNRWYNTRTKTWYYSWAYRENATIDFDKEFVIHKGVRKELSL